MFCFELENCKQKKNNADGSSFLILILARQRTHLFAYLWLLNSNQIRRLVGKGFVKNNYISIYKNISKIQKYFCLKTNDFFWLPFDLFAVQ